LLLPSITPVIRGSTGIDTPTYESLVEQIRRLSYPFITEPGFGYFSLATESLGLTSQASVRLFAAIFCILLVLLATSSPPAARLYICLHVTCILL
jgi:hypothetical protein